MDLAGRLYDLTDEQLEADMSNEEVELVSTILMTATNKNMEPESLIRVAVEAVTQYTNYKLKSKI